MNVLLITQSFSTTHGGGETIFSIIAKALADKGIKVWVMTSRVKGNEYLNHKNIKFIFVTPILESKGGQPPSLKENVLYVIRAIWKGLKIIRQEKIDIIHSNNYAPSFAGSFLSFITSRPNVLVIHDVFSLEKDFWKNWTKQKNISKLNSILGPIFERVITKIKSEAIHTVSNASKDDLIKFGVKKKIFVIPNALEIRKYDSTEINPFQIVYIGRLIFYKNLEVVFKAINIVKQKYPKILFTVIGGGPHKDQLVKTVKNLGIEKNIRFAGHISEDEKYKQLSSSVALVFPSLIEGFGLVVLEAFMLNKPVVVSNVRPLSDIVENTKTGLIVSAKDENDWANAIQKIIENPNLTKDMGLAGRKVLEQIYNVEIMTKKIITMYEQIIKSKI